MRAGISNTTLEETEGLGILEGWVSGRVVASCKDRSNVGLFDSSQVVCVFLCDYLLKQLFASHRCLGWCQSSRKGKSSYTRAVSSHEQNQDLSLVHLHPISLALVFLTISN